MSDRPAGLPSLEDWSDFRIWWLFQLSLIFCNSFWITGKKANLKHSTYKKSVLLYTPSRTSPLKNCIHQSAHELRNWDQNASIFWLAIDFWNKKLKCPAKSSSWFLLRNLCEPAIKTFSVPRSAAILRGTPFITVN